MRCEGSWRSLSSFPQCSGTGRRLAEAGPYLGLDALDWVDLVWDLLVAPADLAVAPRPRRARRATAPDLHSRVDDRVRVRELLPCRATDPALQGSTAATRIEALARWGVSLRAAARHSRGRYRGTACGSRPGMSTRSSSGCRGCFPGWTSASRTSSACRRRSSPTTAFIELLGERARRARLRGRASTARRRGTGSRSSRGSASTTSWPGLAGAPGFPHPEARAVSATCGGIRVRLACTCPTGACRTPSTTSTSSPGWRRCGRWSPAARRPRSSAAT